MVKTFLAKVDVQRGFNMYVTLTFTKPLSLL